MTGAAHVPTAQSQTHHAGGLIQITWQIMHFTARLPQQCRFALLPYPFGTVSLDHLVIDDLCSADINCDRTVDVLDLLAVLAAWGQSGVPEDVNSDGLVDVLDLLQVLSSWGPCE